MINSNMHSQVETWERGQSPVGGDCYHTIYLDCKTDFFFMLIVGAMAIVPYGFFEAFRRNFDFRPTQLNGAMAIAPYGFLLNLKHYNLTYLSQKLFFNVKMIKKYRNR